MADITKIKVNGTEYEIAGSGGGLTGYRPSSEVDFTIVLGILEDGTITKTFNHNDKYIYVMHILWLRIGNNAAIMPTNCEYILSEPQWFGDNDFYIGLIKPTADNWNVVFGNHGGGSND